MIHLMVKKKGFRKLYKQEEFFTLSYSIKIWFLVDCWCWRCAQLCRSDWLFAFSRFLCFVLLLCSKLRALVLHRSNRHLLSKTKIEENQYKTAYIHINEIYKSKNTHGYILYSYLFFLFCCFLLYIVWNFRFEIITIMIYNNIFGVYDALNMSNSTI